MKYLIFGDIHGKSLLRLDKVIDKKNIDTIISLGDYGFVKQIDQFISIKEKYQRQGKTVVDVIGNHDQGIFNNKHIYSPHTSPKKTHSKMYKELMQNKRVYEYLKDLVDSDFKKELYIDEKRFGENYKTIVIHGGLDGRLEVKYSKEDKTKYLWYRIENSEDALFNFSTMDLEFYNIMIRGHDHCQGYYYKDEEDRLFKTDMESILDGCLFELKKEGQHIINPGAFVFGEYATIDTNFNGRELPILEFCRL
jgi:predicted phosphodiesterase